ncbi:MAG: hypothetical protein V2I51_13100, partial [Anderseniella sp.]|nr:hypothetical protein [Anderseniella sp.]
CVLGQINDLQAAVSEGGWPTGDDPGSIRSARGERPGHSRYGASICKTAINSDFSGYTTHELPFTSLFYARSGHEKAKGADRAAPEVHIVQTGPLFKSVTAACARDPMPWRNEKGAAKIATP